MKRVMFVLVTLLIGGFLILTASGRSSAATVMSSALAGPGALATGDGVMNGGVIEKIHGWHCREAFHPDWGYHHHWRACRDRGYGDDGYGYRRRGWWDDRGWRRRDRGWRRRDGCRITPWGEVYCRF